jgi:hypothetical protein
VNTAELISSISYVPVRRTLKGLQAIDADQDRCAGLHRCPAAACSQKLSMMLAFDGQEAKIVPADYALTGIALSAGSHDVRFAYQPRSFRIGLAISATAILATALLLLI